MMMKDDEAAIAELFRLFCLPRAIVTRSFCYGRLSSNPTYATTVDWTSCYWIGTHPVHVEEKPSKRITSVEYI